ncbi:SGNH/GDSL hydrolase family protein [Endothiovibrio diazotrophicus]
MDQKPPARRTVKYAAILLITLSPLLLLVTGELLGRLYLQVLNGSPGRSYGIYTYHPVLGAILRKSSFNTRKTFNNLGFQSYEDVPAGPKPPGELRLVVYGGSTSFCYNLPTGEGWPLRLERDLRDGGVAARMLNGGDVSWSLGHINVRTREEFAGLDADWVVLYSGINELTNAQLVDFYGGDFVGAVRAGERGVFSPRLGQDEWLFRHSLFYKAWRFWGAPRVGRWFSSGERRTPPDPKVVAAKREALRTAVDTNYQYLLRELIAFWRSHGARVAFVIQAISDRDHVNAPRVAVSRRGAAAAAQAGAVVVDAQEVVDGYPGDPHKLFIHSGVHWTAEGSERFARFLAENIPFSQPPAVPSSDERAGGARETH